MLSIDNTEVDEYILPPQCDLVYRSRSVRYALDGSAYEDRLGNPKKRLTLTFVRCPELFWEAMKRSLQKEIIVVSGGVGGFDLAGSYRLLSNDLPTPVTVVHGGQYYCNASVELEEI